MNRVIGHLAALVALGLCAAGGARAADAGCGPAPAEGSVRCDDPGSGMRCSLVTGERLRNQRPWCGSAALTSRYERIHAEQQRLLRAGAIRDADVDAWRARRDACESASCLESLYHEWWRWRDAGRFRSGLPSVRSSVLPSVSSSASPSAALPVPPSAQPAASVAARVPPKPAPAPAVAERASPAPLPAMRDSARPAGPALAPAQAGAPDVLDVSDTSDASPGGTAAAPAASPPDSGVPVSPALLGGVAAFGMGAVYAWQRRRGRDAAPGHGRRRAISAVMAIFYGLLIVNALLLPFTLGWS